MRLVTRRKTMFIHSLEFIKKATLDSIPKKLKNYKEETKCKWYQLLYNEVLEKEETTYKEPYYGQSKDAAKQQMSHIKSGKRHKMTPTVLNLIAKNMGISVSELLWGKKKDWEPLLPALFYLIIAESVNSSDVSFSKKLSLQEKSVSVLKDSVDFSRELAQKEIAAEYSNGMVYFEIQNKPLATAIFRLYQSDVAEKFCNLFEEVFITSDYSLGYIEREVKLFANRVFKEVLLGSANDVASLGYQVYKTYNLYFSFESKEHFASFTSRSVLEEDLKKESEEYADTQLLHYLDEEQAIMYRSIENFVNEISKVQAKQDKRLGIHLADTAIFKKAFDSVGFNKEYFEKSTIEIDNRRLSQEELNEQIKQAVKDATLPI